MTDTSKATKNQKQRRTFWSSAAALLALTIGLVLSAVVSQSVRQSEEALAQGRSDAVIAQAQNGANFALGVRFNSVKRLADRWEAVGGIPLDYWKAEAELKVRGLPDVLSMLLTNDKGEILHEQVRGDVEPQTVRDVFVSDYQQAGFQESFESEKVFISKPTSTRNGLLILIGLPLYADGQFNGYLLAGFAPAELLGGFLADIKSSGYSINVEGEGIVIYDGLLPDAVMDPFWSREATIQFGDNVWKIRVSPTQARLDELFSGLPSIILVGSVLLSLAIAYGIDRTTRIERAERRLRSSNAKLERALDEQKALSKDLEAERDRAGHASQLKSEFLANMSHEIRTPMNAIIGFTQLLSQSDLREQESEWVEIVKTSGENLLALLNSILELSRIESGQIEINLASCQLEDLFARTRNQWIDEAKAKGIELMFEIDPSVPRTIQTDESILRQIIFNLVSNAVKFTDCGGVTVRLEPFSPPGSNSSILRCSVKDTGIGIDDAHHARLFQKFTQGDGSLNRKHGGTGLGLALSHSLAQLLGGKLSFESQLNKGSIFYFDFPYRIETPELENAAVNDAFSQPERSIA